MDKSTKDVILFTLNTMQASCIGRWPQGTTLRVALEECYKEKLEWAEILRLVSISFGCFLPKIFYIHMIAKMEEQSNDTGVAKEPT